MEGKRLPKRDGSVSRRDVLVAHGSIAVLVGTAGCLGLFRTGEDEDEAATDENETEEAANDEQEANGAEPDDDEDDETAADETTADEDETGDEDDAMDDDVDGEDDDMGDDEDNDLDDEDDELEDDTPEDEGEDGDEEQDDEGDDTDDEEVDDEDEDEDGEEERDLSLTSYTNDEYGYELEYPAVWTVDESPAEYVEMVADDDTAGLWIWVDDARISFERVIENYHADFEPNPEVDIQADDAVTIESGEEGHRFVIEMTEPDVPSSPYIAHELVVQSTGREYFLSFGVERAEYDEQYAVLAETVLASFAILDK